MSNSASSPRKKPRKGKGVDSEHCLHLHCQQWLEKSGIWDRLLIFHVANERKGSIGTAMHFKRMGVRPGVADYLAFPAARVPIAIELKDDDGKQSGAQETFMKKWLEAGGRYSIIRDLGGFQAEISSLLEPTFPPRS